MLNKEGGWDGERTPHTYIGAIYGNKGTVRTTRGEYIKVGASLEVPCSY